jgi:hypothetical protein
MQMSNWAIRTTLAALIMAGAAAGCERPEDPVVEPVLERTSPAHTPPSRRVRIALGPVPASAPAERPAQVNLSRASSSVYL